MHPTEDEDAPARPANWKLATAGGAVALAVFWFATQAHLERACVVQDTPYLPLCPAAATEPAAIQEQLRERVAGSPGDGWAWTRLLAATREAPSDGVLRAAALVAPNHPYVLRWRAAKALERGEHAQAVEVLVQMVTDRNSADAGRLLAQLAATPQGVALLRPHLDEATRWLPSVLSHMAALKMPAGASLPLVAAALQAGTLPDDARRAYMRNLKASGQWLDAYALWLAHHQDVVPLLYNAGFDLPLELDGFDWEFTPVMRSQAGVIVGQGPVARRGLILELDFTGRRFAAPVLRQHVFLPPGAYRLTGEYASKVRSEQGLSWSVACSFGSKAVAGTSAPLPDTGGAWRRFQLEFRVAPDCGPVAVLQLAPTAAYEAAAGMRGEFLLDAFSLSRTTE